MWPTELGFVPTSDAIETSLEHLNTNYIDLYLLHWPQCDHAVEWMHCEVNWYALGEYILYTLGLLHAP